MTCALFCFTETHPNARLICTFGQTLFDASKKTISLNKFANPEDSIADPFGWPLSFAAFGSGIGHVVAKYAENDRIDADFTLCFHIKHYNESIMIFHLIGYLHVNFDTRLYVR